MIEVELLQQEATFWHLPLPAIIEKENPKQEVAQTVRLAVGWGSEFTVQLTRGNEVYTPLQQSFHDSDLRLALE